MEMSTALQVVLFIASLTFILLAACIIPIAFHVRRQVKRMAHTVEHLKSNVQVLLRDSRELVQNMNVLSNRASQQMDDIGKVVHTVHQWTERADRLVNEVGSAIEPPVFSVVQNMNLIRAGMAMFLRVLFHPGKNKKIKKEKEHV